MSSGSLATKMAMVTWFTAAAPLLVLNAPSAAAATPPQRVDVAGDANAVVTIAQIDHPAAAGAVSATLALRGDHATVLNLPAGRYSVRHHSEGPAAVVAGDRIVKLAPGERTTIDLGPVSSEG